MQETLSRALEWFRERPNPQKTAIGVVAILGLVLASPVVWVVAALAFIVALVGMVVQAVRRRSVRIWLVVGGAALVGIMVFGTFVESIYGPIPVDRADVHRVEEPVVENHPGGERSSVEEIVATLEGEGNRGSVPDRAAGRYGVLVALKSQESTDATLLRGATEAQQNVTSPSIPPK